MTLPASPHTPEPTEPEPPTTRALNRSGRGAGLVAAGILASRLVGLLRNRVLAYYFGTEAAGDAYTAALRIPNFLQNLFGEGALSASFIPVYARLVAEGDEEEAGRVAGAVFALLAVVTSVLVLLGVLFAPLLVDLIAFGFDEQRRALTITLVRIVFPGIGLLVLSAWCLGILNSHRRFFLSYAAPVAMSLAIIGALVLYGGSRDLSRLAVAAAWGAVAGSALTFGVQLPSVLRLVPRLRLRWDTTSPHVRSVVRNFGPAALGRGVVQVSAFIDQAIASLLPGGSVVALSYASMLYTLPVSLFGMAVSAAELPSMSAVGGSDDAAAGMLRERLSAGLRRVAFFVVPSAAAFLVLGDSVATLVLRNGRFGGDAARWVWTILAGSAVGLVASTFGRLYASVFYARRDSRTPLRFALVRVLLTTVLGYLFAMPLPRAIGLDPQYGAAGLTASAGLAGWVEFALLRRALHARIGVAGVGSGYMARVWGSAVLAAAAAWGVRLAIPAGRAGPFVEAAAVLGVFCLVYGGAAVALGVPMARQIAGRLTGRLRRR